MKALLVSAAMLMLTSLHSSPMDADDELQMHEFSCLETALHEFGEKKGSLILLEGDVVPFTFLPGDTVFPACSGANNRSQTLWNILRPYADKIYLMPPHATQYGFDPYNGRLNWLRLKKIAYEDDEFIAWAGVPKSKKLGWETFADWLTRWEATHEELNMLTEYFNREYFHPDVPDGTRRIYVTFKKNAHIHLHRLNQTNASLENVVLLVFPIDDLIHAPLPEWDTYPRSQKCYAELAKLLTPYLDFRYVD